jgi:serine/threonine protein kinase
VAIKQIKNIFTVFETSKRIYREIKLLRSLDHPNVVKIVHIQEPRWVQRACWRSDLRWRDPPLWRGYEG